MRDTIDLNWKEFGNALLNATPNGVVVFDNALQALISNQPARNCLGVYPGSFLAATVPSLTASARGFCPAGPLRPAWWWKKMTADIPSCWGPSIMMMRLSALLPFLRT